MCIQRNSPFTGWYVLDGCSVIGFIPYSSSFEYNGVRYMATVDAEAERIGKMMVSNEHRAESEFFRSHPELNP